MIFPDYFAIRRIAQARAAREVFFHFVLPFVVPLVLVMVGVSVYLIWEMK